MDVSVGDLFLALCGSLLGAGIVVAWLSDTAEAPRHYSIRRSSKPADLQAPSEPDVQSAAELAAGAREGLSSQCGAAPSKEPIANGSDEKPPLSRLDIAYQKLRTLSQARTEYRRQVQRALNRPASSDLATERCEKDDFAPLGSQTRFDAGED